MVVFGGLGSDDKFLTGTLYGYLKSEDDSEWFVVATSGAEDPERAYHSAVVLDSQVSGRT